MRDAFALGGGPYLFCEKLAQRGGVQHLLGQELLELRVLVLELLQPLGLGDVHAAVLGLPVVKRRFGDAVLARQIGGLRPGLVWEKPLAANGGLWPLSPSPRFLILIVTPFDQLAAFGVPLSNRALAGRVVTAPVAGLTHGHGLLPKKAGAEVL